MTTIRCKNQKLIDSQRICCFDNDSITIEHRFDEKSTLFVTFSFHYSENDEKPKYTITSSENGKIVIDLYDFKSSFGTGLKRPQVIAKYFEQNISIVFFVTLLPDANPIIDYSLYLED